MELEGVEVEETFAESFDSWYARVLLTAVNRRWVENAVSESTGYATSMIGCSAEAGLEGLYPPSATPDGRPGAGMAFFTTRKDLEKELLGRIGQCILTSPTARVFALGEGRESLDVGYKMKFFGDGYEREEKKYGREMSVVPIMMGEFEMEKSLPIGKGVAGANFIILAENQASALIASEAAVEAIEHIEGAITPFPGGVVASGSKVGSNSYKFMQATTNEKFCPTLKEKVDSSALGRGMNAAAEIVIDAISEEKAKEAMKAGMRAAVKVQGVKKITAGNFGGNLGKVHIKLGELWD